MSQQLLSAPALSSDKERKRYMAISLSKNQTMSLEVEAGAGLKKAGIGPGSDLTSNALQAVSL